MTRSNSPSLFLSKEENSLVENAIAVAEKQTSAEIKLIIKRYNWFDLHKAGVRLFKKHKLYKTKERNAILILLVLTNKELLVLGDIGIQKCVAPTFWDKARDIMLPLFSKNTPAEGLCEGIKFLTPTLLQNFPPSQKNENEISDGVAYED